MKYVTGQLFEVTGKSGGFGCLAKLLAGFI